MKYSDPAFQFFTTLQNKWLFIIRIELPAHVLLFLFYSIVVNQINHIPNRVRVNNMV